MREITSREAMNLLGVSRQAIHIAIKHKRLPAKKDDRGHYLLNVDDLDLYIKGKWNRHETVMVNGVKVFSKDSGAITPQDAAKRLGVPVQHVYYAIRMAYLKKTSVGQNLIITEEAVRNYAESPMFKQRHREKSELAV